MTGLVTPIYDSLRKIHDHGDILPADECRVFKDSSGLATFVRHVYDGDSDKILYSEVILIGGSSEDVAQFPLMEVGGCGVTFHQPLNPIGEMSSIDDISDEACGRLWRDRRDKDVLVGRTLSGALRAISVGGSEVEFPCLCRGTGTVLNLGA